MTEFADEYHRQVEEAGGMDPYVKEKLHVRKPLLDRIRRYTPPKGRILELGAGTSILSQALSQEGYDVTCVDHDPHIVSLQEEIRDQMGGKAKSVLADLRTFVPDKPVDTTFNNGVLEHLPEDVIIENINRVLAYSRMYIFGIPTVFNHGNLMGDEQLWSYWKWKDLLSRTTAETVEAFSFFSRRNIREAINRLLACKLYHFSTGVGFVLKKSRQKNATNGGLDLNEDAGNDDTDYPRDWAEIDSTSAPNIVCPPPGPESKKYQSIAERHTQGFSSQVKGFPVVFKRAHGVTMEDADGNTYIDLSSGICVANIGHSHPHVVRAVNTASEQLMNCHDFTTPQKAQLLERIPTIVPYAGITQLFPSGTDAVEAGLRMARSVTGKPGTLGLSMGFHGKTLGAASITRDQGDLTHHFYQSPRPHCYRCDLGLDYKTCKLGCAEKISRMLTSHPEIGVVVVEPIQGWAGAQTPPTDYLPSLRKICDQHGVLLMADEVLTGMGRTGRMFCMEHSGVEPDILIVGKGLGNGIPIAATILHQKHKDSMGDVSASSTFGGNPVACSAACAVLDVFEKENIVERARNLGIFLRDRFDDLKERYDIIGDVRGMGCYLGMEIVRDQSSKEPDPALALSIYQRAFAKGLVWIPANHILRIAPPLIMSTKIAERAVEIIEESIRESLQLSR
jgi:4-aminobutyrate aminotransferase/4-aminobutyrate aminotransferase/(S)-3-amino-2-methylpropionate transaminase